MNKPNCTWRIEVLKGRWTSLRWPADRTLLSNIASQILDYSYVGGFARDSKNEKWEWRLVLESEGPYIIDYNHLDVVDMECIYDVLMSGHATGKLYIAGMVEYVFCNSEGRDLMTTRDESEALRFIKQCEESFCTVEMGDADAERVYYTVYTDDELYTDDESSYNRKPFKFFKRK